MFKAMLALPVCAALLPSCGGATQEQLASRAAFDLQCPESEVTVVKIDDRSRGVRGCGKQVTYVESCDGPRANFHTKCTWVQNSTSSDGPTPPVAAAVRAAASPPAPARQGDRLWARFKDASGLTDRARVTIAGLTIGEIAERRVDGRLARITIVVDKGLQIWSNAALAERTSTTNGEHYLELDPGTPEQVDAQGQPVKNPLLRDGDQILRVIEGSDPGPGG